MHNYLDSEKSVQVKLEIPGGILESTDALSKTVTIAPHGEARIDWRVKVQSSGEAVIRMLALTDEESDAM